MLKTSLASLTPGVPCPTANIPMELILKAFTFLTLMIPLVLPAPASFTTLGICQTLRSCFLTECPLRQAWFWDFVGAQLALVKLSLWVKTLKGSE